MKLKICVFGLKRGLRNAKILTSEMGLQQSTLHPSILGKMSPVEVADRVAKIGQGFGEYSEAIIRNEISGETILNKLDEREIYQLMHRLSLQNEKHNSIILSFIDFLRYPVPGIYGVLECNSVSRYNHEYYCTLEKIIIHYLNDGTITLEITFNVCGSGRLGSLQRPDHSKLHFRSRRIAVSESILKEDTYYKIRGDLIYNIRPSKVAEEMIDNDISFCYGSSGYDTVTILNAGRLSSIKNPDL